MFIVNAELSASCDKHAEPVSFTRVTVHTFVVVVVTVFVALLVAARGRVHLSIGIISIFFCLLSI